MYSITFPVRYYECDPMGVVHHSEYIRYFDLARARWLNDAGYGSECFDEDFIVTPVVSVDCQYKRPVKFGGCVTVTVELENYTGVRFEVHQSVLDEEGNLCAQGNVTICFQSTKLGKPVRCPERLDKILRNNLKP